MIQAIGKDFFKGQEFTIYMVCAKAARDGEYKAFDSGKTKGSVCVKAKESADGTPMWVDVSAWGHEAAIPAGAKKGDPIFAIGQLREREYNGKKYYDLNADFLSVAGSSTGTPPKPPHSAAPAASTGDFAEIGEEDGELPF
jgi:single-stranded DNA-binding protein